MEFWSRKAFHLRVAWTRDKQVSLSAFPPRHRSALGVLSMGAHHSCFHPVGAAVRERRCMAPRGPEEGAPLWAGITSIQTEV